MKNNEKIPVLLVDDRPENLTSLEVILEDMDLDLTKALSGNEALRHSLRNEFALILMDVQMPGMDGFETAELLRSNPRTRHIPIIFITAGMNDFSSLFKGYETGAVDYLIKPIEPLFLKSKVRVFSELHRQRVKIEQHERELEAQVAERTMALRQTTEQLLSEKSLSEVIINCLPGVFYGFDENRRLVYWNKKLEEFLGLDPNEMHDFDFFSRINHYSRNEIIKMFEKVLSKDRMLDIEINLIDGSGNSIPHFCIASPMTIGDTKYLIGIGIDITIQKHNHDALIAARDAADAANLAKSHFLANMSHEIRTPMNAIIGLSGLSLKTQLTSRQRDYIDKIASSAHSLMGILNDILDISKIEAGMLSMDYADFSLYESFSRIADLMSISSEQKGIEILFRVEKDVPEILNGDSMRLEQVLLNLAGNAVKFTHKGHVLLSVSMDSENKNDGTVVLHFSVEDTGIGLTEDEIGRIFKPFTQSDSSTTRKYGGTGLGLSICSRLVEMMKGKISVVSVPGSGSIFNFTAVFKKGKIRQVEGMISSADLGGLRVLVADDNSASLDIMENLLESFSMRVITVSNGDEALREYEKSEANDDPYSIIFLDWRMPGMDGIETAELILKKQCSGPVPKIVITSAFANDDLRKKAECAGAHGFLDKPVLRGLLYKKIIHTLGDEPGVFHKKECDALPLSATGFRFSDLRVLLAEDQPINRQIVCELLGSLDITVEVAHNGKEAVDIVEQTAGNFDLILMDLQMPEMDGYEATSIIRKKWDSLQLPIIAMTAHAMSEERDKCLNAGMNEHLPKPIVPEKLYSAILKWAGHKKVILSEQFPEAYEKECEGMNIFNQNLPGINLESALDRLCGRKKLFLSVLSSFGDYCNTAAIDIRKSVDLKDIKLLENTVHTMKGVAGNISAEKVYSICLEIEACLKTDGILGVKFLVAKLLDSIDEVLESSRIIMEASKKIESTTKKGSAEEIRAVLEKLATALDSNNLDAVDLMEEVREMLPCSVELEELKKAMDVLNFKKASEKLGCLICSIKLESVCLE